MSRTTCQIQGRHVALHVVCDEDGEPIYVECQDWECGCRWPISDPVDDT